MSILKNLRDASSLQDLAKMLGYKASTLAYLLYKVPAADKYQKFQIPKKSGGVREICAPIEQLKTLQRRLANVLYACRKEIENVSGLRPLSHGFREKLSIVTNAHPHRRQRYVLNIDLQDFFPSLNFGRVRGYFIKNNGFKLSEKVATLIAQIACHENRLPQGSPCSPVISDLLGHLLDIRLVQLAKEHRVTYSRYADDLTFSTGQVRFPSALALRDDIPGSEWRLGGDLIGTIERAGFAINPTKTRMQCSIGRQIVTGLTVNAKVNIRQEYYRRARAMCHSLFDRGSYHRGAMGATTAGTATPPERVSTFGPIEGILSHIHYVKNIVDTRNESEKKKNSTAARRLYARLLFYRYFVAIQKPLIVCEGITDNVYLKLAIKKLTAFHPKLGAPDAAGFKYAVTFFRYANQAQRILQLGGGTGDLKHLILNYGKHIQSFKYRLLKSPVIVFIDNDKGAAEIFSVISGKYGISVKAETTAPFFHLTDNLYLVKTPANGAVHKSCIEDFFDPLLLNTKIDGKIFNPDKAHAVDGEYGKIVFAEKVVRPNAATIDFSNFSSLLERIVSVMDHYKAPAMAASSK